MLQLPRASGDNGHHSSPSKMPDTGGPTTQQISNLKLFERTVKITGEKITGDFRFVNGSPIPLKFDRFYSRKDPAIELQLQKFAYDPSGIPRPVPGATRAQPRKCLGKDREVLELDPGCIARTPTKTHMGLVTDFNWTVRMKKTQDLNFLVVQVFDDEGIQGDNRRDYNIFGGAIEIDIHRLIGAGDLGAAELTREFPLLSKAEVSNGHELPRRKIGSVLLKMKLDELAPWPTESLQESGDKAKLANNTFSYPDRNIGTVGIRFVPNAQGFHVITDIKPEGPVWRTGRALIGDILYKVDIQAPDNRFNHFEQAIDCKGLSVHQVIELLTGPANSTVKLALLDGKFPYLPPKVLEVQREATQTVSVPNPDETQKTNSKQWYL